MSESSSLKLRARVLRFFNLEPGEWLPVLWSGLYFFAVLAALMVLRPARDALGMQRGMDEVRWLFVGTAVVTLAMNPIFGWLVSRYRRMIFIGTGYGFFALSLVGFYALLTAAPDAVDEVSGQIFYVWFSVFNFFATMMFWALMADRFTLAQSKRFFPLLAAGGTLGAIVGPWLASVLAVPLGTAALLLISVAFLAVAVVAAFCVARSQHGPVGLESGAASQGESSASESSASRTEALLGGSPWEGITAVFSSRYLAGIGAYVLILSVIVTFLYFTRLNMVADIESGLDQRTSWLGRIDFYTQVATLVLQCVVAGHLMQRIGVALTMTLLPLTAALGFIGLAMLSSLTMLIVIDAVFRAVQRAVMRPARETLFTVVSRAEKYKAKAFIDTFGYRLGDVLGAQTEGWLARLSPGLLALTWLTVPLAIVWGALGYWLGREQTRRSASSRSEPT